MQITIGNIMSASAVAVNDGATIRDVLAQHPTRFTNNGNPIELRLNGTVVTGDDARALQNGDVLTWITLVKGNAIQVTIGNIMSASAVSVNDGATIRDVLAQHSTRFTNNGNPIELRLNGTVVTGDDARALQNGDVLTWITLVKGNLARALARIVRFFRA